MTDPQTGINSSIEQFEKLRKNIAKITTRQVRNNQEKLLVKATVQAWFTTYHPIIKRAYGEEILQTVQNSCKTLLELSDRATLKDKYILTIKTIKNELIKIRSSTIGKSIETQSIRQNIPNFSIIISDEQMIRIVEKRWYECERCIEAGAPLAAIVMMGGLIETLFLARINQLNDKVIIFTAKVAPKDKRGKTLKLNEWCLRNYIDVCHEIGWITKTGKDISEVLRDYRNYVHPHKERRHNVNIELHDAKLLWQVCILISQQIIESVNN